MTNRFASPLSLVVAAILGGFVSQGISRWMPEAQAQEEKSPNVLRGEGLELVGKDGKPRFSISTFLGHVIMEVHRDSPKNGQSPFYMVARDNGAAIHLVGSDGSAVILGAGGTKDDPRGNPRVSIRDGKTERAVLGVTDLETVKTGDTTKTAPSSLTLFDKEGKVLWKAP